MLLSFAYSDALSRSFFHKQTLDFARSSANTCPNLTTYCSPEACSELRNEIINNTLAIQALQHQSGLSPHGARPP